MGMMCGHLLLYWSEPLSGAWLPTTKGAKKKQPIPHTYLHTQVHMYEYLHCSTGRVGESVSSLASEKKEEEEVEKGLSRLICHTARATMNHSVTSLLINTLKHQMTHSRSRTSFALLVVCYFNANVLSCPHQPTRTHFIVRSFFL